MLFEAAYSKRIKNKTAKICYLSSKITTVIQYTQTGDLLIFIQYLFLPAPVLNKYYPAGKISKRLRAITIQPVKGPFKENAIKTEI